MNEIWKNIARGTIPKETLEQWIKCYFNQAVDFIGRKNLNKYLI